MLTDNVALVSGAAAGIGLATARRFLAEGAHVIVVDRNADTAPALHKLRELLDPSGGQLLTVTGDVTDPATWRKAADLVRERWGRLDILVNNVASVPTRESALAATTDQWRTTLDINLLSVVEACRVLSPLVANSEAGVIVNIASSSARYPEPFLADYAASKAAVLSFTGALATELGRTGTRVFAVAPGPTRTPLWDKPGGFIDSISERYALPREQAVTHHISNVRQIPLGRPANPEEIADVIVFSSSRRAGYLNGEVIAVHGGMATHLM